MKKIILLLIVLCSFAGVNAQYRYQGEANIGLGIGVGKNSLTRFSVNTIHGVRLNKYVFLGLGVGADLATTEFKTTMFDEMTETVEVGKPNVIPMFANVKGYYPLNNKFSLFASASVGYGNYGEEDAEWFEINDENGQSEKWLFGFRGAGGIYYTPEIGCTYKLTKKLGLNFALGYQAQVFKYELSLGPKGDIEQYNFTRTASSLSIKVGLTW